MTSLINIDLNPANTIFLQTLTAAEQQNLKPESLRRVRDHQTRLLDQQWPVLLQLARLGREDALPAAFDTFLREWARKEAMKVILDNRAFLDVTHPGVQQAIWDVLSRRAQALNAELAVAWTQGERERAQVANERNDRWEPFMRDWMTEMRTREQYWHKATAESLKQREDAWGEGHAIAQQWAFHADDSLAKALEAMQKTQDGLDRQYQFMETAEGHIVNLLQPQRQAQLAAEAAEDLQFQRRSSRLGCFLGFFVIAIGLLGLAFILASNIIH